MRPKMGPEASASIPSDRRGLSLDGVGYCSLENWGLARGGGGGQVNIGSRPEGESRDSCLRNRLFRKKSEIPSFNIQQRTTILQAKKITILQVD